MGDKIFTDSNITILIYFFLLFLQWHIPLKTVIRKNLFFFYSWSIIPSKKHVEKSMWL